MPEEKQEEQKLGPNATYQPEDEGRKEPITVHGVAFVPGKSVNLEERLGKQKSQEVLKKLSGNPHFNVDGGTDWKAEREAKSKAEEQEAQDVQKAREEAEQQAQGGAPLPPPDWKGPEKEELESDSGARRPTMPKSGSRSGSSSRGGSEE